MDGVGLSPNSEEYAAPLGLYWMILAWDQISNNKNQLPHGKAPKSSYTWVSPMINAKFPEKRNCQL